MPNGGGEILVFGPFELDPKEHRLLRDGEPVVLQPKVFQTLLYLVRHAGQVVEKEELFAEIWPGVVVEEANLSRTIWLIRKALGDSAEEENSIETVPKVGYRFVAPVRRLERSGADVREFVSAIEPVESVSPRSVPRFLPILVGALLLVVIGLWMAIRPPRAIVAPHRPTVAVLPFSNLTGRPEAQWLSTAFAEMVDAELSAGGRLRTISGDTLKELMPGTMRPTLGNLSPAALEKIRARLGTDMVLSGSYLALPPGPGREILLTVRLQSSSGAETALTVAEKGTEADLFRMTSLVGESVRRKLALPARSAEEAISVRAALPADPGASRLYAEGLAALRSGDALTARRSLGKAVELAPDFALAHAALGDAFSTLGYDADARAEAKKAFERSAGLTREDRLSIEGRLRECEGDSAKAVEVYRTLFGFFPDELDYGLRLARAQTSVGRAPDAFETVKQLRRLAQPDASDPRIDLAEAEAADSQADYRLAYESASRAIAKARARGSLFLLARACLKEGWALRNLGRTEAALADFEESKRISLQMGDAAGQGSANLDIAVILHDRGDLAASRDTYQKALAVFSAAGNEKGKMRVLNDLAMILGEQGDLAAAQSLFDKARTISEETQDQAATVAILGNLAEVSYLGGDLGKARAMRELAMEIARRMGDRDDVALSMESVGEVLCDQGDLPGAMSRYVEALSILRDVGDKRYVADVLFHVGELSAIRGDLAQSRRAHEEAMGIRTQLGDRREAASSRAALAQISLEEGDPPGAEKASREALREFEGGNDFDHEIFARLVVVRCLLAENRVVEARRMLEGFAQRVSKSAHRNQRLAAEIVAGRVLAASGDSGDRQEAVRRLSAARAEASRGGLIGCELECRLALAEIEAADGRAAEARSLLGQVKRDALAKGFGLLARKAGRAL